jgi:hypothetical protein
MDLREKIIVSVKKSVPKSQTAYTLTSGGCDHGAWKRHQLTCKSLLGKRCQLIPNALKLLVGFF